MTTIEPVRALAAERPSSAHTVSFYGLVLHVPFQTDTDLTAFMPPGLLPVDPHRAFLKAERLKMSAPGKAHDPPAFTQYHQICVATLAAPPGMEPRHRNLVMWEDRPWGIGGSLVAVKRYGAVEMTYLFERDYALVANGTVVPFRVEVEVAGYTVLSFTGELDGTARTEAPAFNGFFVGGGSDSPLRALTLDSSELTRPLHGRGDLYFGEAPNNTGQLPGWTGNWPATLLGTPRTDGCVVHDLVFTRTYGTEFTQVTEPGSHGQGERPEQRTT